MAIITIKRRNRERKDGKAALYAVFCIQGDKIRLPLGIAVTQDEWDEKTGTVKGHSSLAKDYNLVIGDTLARINTVFVKARLADETLTKKRFHELYKRAKNGSQTFNEFAQAHLRSLYKVLSFNTAKQHKSILKKLGEYQPEIEFSDLTLTFIRSYEAHMRKIGNNDNTIAKNLKIIKTYILAAKRAGLLANNPFDDYRIKRARSIPSSLSLCKPAARSSRLFTGRPKRLPTCRCCLPCSTGYCGMRSPHCWHQNPHLPDHPTMPSLPRQ